MPSSELLKRYVIETIMEPKIGKEIGIRKIIYHPKNIDIIFLTYQIDAGDIFKKIISTNKSFRLGKSSVINPKDKFMVAKGLAPLRELYALRVDQKFVLYNTPLIPIFVVVEKSSDPKCKVRPLGKKKPSQEIGKHSRVLAL